MEQEKLFDLLKAAVSPCECVKAAKQELVDYEDSTAKQALMAVASYAITRDL